MKGEGVVVCLLVVMVKVVLDLVLLVAMTAAKAMERKTTTRKILYGRTKGGNHVIEAWSSPTLSKG